MKSSKEQSEAITHFNGPALVVAGPGSGKTYVLVERILTLISKYHVPARAILVITFTKAAAVSMEKRFKLLAKENKMDKAACGVKFGTFHAAFLRILTLYAPDGKYEIVKEKDALKLLAGSIREFNRVYGEEYGAFSERAELLDEEMLKLKKYENLRSRMAENLEETADEYLREKILFDIYKNRLHQAGKIDFEDITEQCAKLLLERPKVLERVRSRFKFFLVDEVQDINRQQYDILKLLAGNEQNIFAVGDDDQSIYGFRGATPGIMKRFLADYQGIKEIHLSTNYRCKGNIVNAASQVIANNKDRISKHFLAMRDGGTPVSIVKTETRDEETDRIIEFIKAEKNRGVLYSDMAVLFRNNRQQGKLILKLGNEGIPVNSKKKPNVNIRIEIIKDLTTILRMSQEYPEGVRRSDLIAISDRIEPEIDCSLLLEEKIKLEEYQINNPAFIKLSQNLKMINSLNSFAAIMYIRKAMGYERYIVGSKGEDNEGEITQRLFEISEDSRKYPDIEEWIQVKEKELRGDGDGVYSTKCLEEADEDRKDRINVMTMHGSKGLEFETVILSRLNDREFIRDGMSEEAIEEERRIFYVAMTRAK